MKLRYGFLAAAAGLLSLGSCADRSGFIDAKDTQRTPALNSATLSPLSNESGSVRAYVGTEVSVQGFNLDRIGSVTMDDIEVELTAQNIKELKFKVPALDYAQNDLPYAVRLLAFDQEHAQVFAYDYFVTVPVTDAIITGYAPAEGTVGTEITLSGRNLAQITRVRFGSATVEAADFTEVDEAGAFVKFRVPAGSYEAPDVDVAIAAEWGTETIDVTGEALFWVHVPAFFAVEQAEGENSAVGDELELTGRNLDLVTAVKWGETALVLVEKSSETLKVRFPSSIEQADPAVQAKALVVEWGLTEPAQTATLVEAWRVDTTPSSTVLTPEFGQMTVEDGKFYLGKTVTVAGANLTVVEGVELQYGSERVEAEVLAGATDSELKFTVPDGVTFDTATEVSVVALHNGGEQLEIGKATVYPFYCYKGIRVGLGSNSSSSYTEYAAANAFFYPDTGRVVSTDEWVDSNLDPYAASGANTAVTAGNTLTKSAISSDEYYAVKPYVFFIANSSHKLTIAGCANTANQLKNHFRYVNGKATALPGTFGTPIMMYRVVTAAATADAIRSGAFETMKYDGAVPSSGGPAFGTAEAANTWVKGSVLVASYSSYTAGGKPSAVSDFAKTGYIVIRDITCADSSTGLANADRAGYIEFDCYWSKTLNE